MRNTVGKKTKLQTSIDPKLGTNKYKPKQTLKNVFLGFFFLLLLVLMGCRSLYVTLASTKSAVAEKKLGSSNELIFGLIPEIP